MPDLLILIIPSLIAIAIMVLLIRVTGVARPVVLKADEPVIDTINEHFEGASVERIVRSVDGTGALAYLKAAPGLVLVRTLGDRMAVRALNASALKALAGEGAELNITLNDFTWPKMQLGFANEGARKAEELVIHKTIKGAAHG